MDMDINKSHITNSSHLKSKPFSGMFSETKQVKRNGETQLVYM